MQHMTDERCLASVQWQEKEVLLLSNLAASSSIERGLISLWQLPTLPQIAVPSAQTVFTSLFGMGRGVFPVAIITI